MTDDEKAMEEAKRVMARMLATKPQRKIEAKVSRQKRLLPTSHKAEA